MPVLFVGYALLTWFFAARYRRHVLGLTALAVSLAGLLGVNWVHGRLPVWFQNPDFHIMVLQSIMWPYTGIVAGIGLFIFVLPKRTDDHCRYCGYDLASLLEEFASVDCPECGRRHRRDGRGERPSGTSGAPPGERRIERRTPEPDTQVPARDDAERPAPRVIRSDFTSPKPRASTHAI